MECHIWAFHPSPLPFLPSPLYKPQINHFYLFYFRKSQLWHCLKCCPACFPTSQLGSPSSLPVAWFWGRVFATASLFIHSYLFTCVCLPSEVCNHSWFELNKLLHTQNTCGLRSQNIPTSVFSTCAACTSLSRPHICSRLCRSTASAALCLSISALRCTLVRLFPSGSRLHTLKQLYLALPVPQRTSFVTSHQTVVLSFA